MKSKVMSIIENACNGGILDHSAEKCVNDFLAHAHRYLQGTFFKFIIKYVQANAIHYKDNPNRWFDGRNEWVGEMCAKICDSTPEMKIYEWQKKEYEKEFPMGAKDVCESVDEDTIKTAEQY
ncbi:MAG: hypothetical protein II502_01305 [Paludibacteraceae bacterium]|nr:hypothetical protein [Paludibacteraceae bacterium]